MKKYYFLIIVALILGLALTGCSLLSNISQVPANEQSGITYLTKGGPTENEADEYTLYAGQTIDVGIVKVWNDNTNLYVKYEITEEGWVLTETHLAVVITTYRNFPRTKTGNPKVGKFPYKCCYDETEEEWLFVQKPDTLSGTCDADGKEDATLTEITYTIPLTWGIGAKLFIAAHAVVEKQIEGEIIQEETAWADGFDFPGKNWATYFTYHIAGEPPTISSADLAGPYNKDEDREFSVKTVNPECGFEYPRVIFNYIIENITLLDITSFEYYDGATWVSMPMIDDGSGNVTGFFGPFPGCFLMEVDYSEETTFRINIGIVGTFPVTITLINCENDEELAILTEDVVVSPETVLAVGDNYGGGKVAYILQPGESNGVYNYDANVQHGLIAATADQSDGIEWITGGNTQTTLNGNTLTALGKGQANTNAMKAQTGYTGGAAKVCDDYSVTVDSVTYDDWFLPSKDELNKLHLEKDAIGGFPDTTYWSSSEGNATNAWIQYFYNGNQYNYPKYYTYYRVRAVRAF